MAGRGFHCIVKLRRVWKIRGTCIERRRSPSRAILERRLKRVFMGRFIRTGLGVTCLEKVDVPTLKNVDTHPLIYDSLYYLRFARGNAKD